MKKLMTFLFLSCYKATELIEKNFHFKLSYLEKIQLRMHKMMCNACTQYEKQSLILEKGISKMDNKAPNIDIVALKIRISSKLHSFN